MKTSLSDIDLQLSGSRWRVNSWQPRRVTIRVLLRLTILFALGWGKSLRGEVRQRAIIQHSLKNQLAFVNVMIKAMPHPAELRNFSGALTGCDSRYPEEVNLNRDKVTNKQIDILPFSPPDGKGQTSHQGTGLAMCRMLCERMRGR